MSNRIIEDICCFRCFDAMRIATLSRISLWSIEQAVEAVISLVEKTPAPSRCRNKIMMIFIIEQVPMASIEDPSMMCRVYAYLSYGRSSPRSVVGVLHASYEVASRPYYIVVDMLKLYMPAD